MTNITPQRASTSLEQGALHQRSTDAACCESAPLSPTPTNRIMAARHHIPDLSLRATKAIGRAACRQQMRGEEVRVHGRTRTCTRGRRGGKRERVRTQSGGGVVEDGGGLHDGGAHGGRARVSAAVHLHLVDHRPGARARGHQSHQCGRRGLLLPLARGRRGSGGTSRAQGSTGSLCLVRGRGFSWIFGLARRGGKGKTGTGTGTGTGRGTFPSRRF